jgi:hypothetical protein
MMILSPELPVNELHKSQSFQHILSQSRILSCRRGTASASPGDALCETRTDNPLTLAKIQARHAHASIRNQA